MGKIAVHEFITLDGVIDEPRWTMGYPFDPKMGEAIGRIMGASEALLLGRRTFEMFAPASGNDQGSRGAARRRPLCQRQWHTRPRHARRQPRRRVAPVRLPLTLGTGQRLFADGGPAAKFSLAGTEAYESGVLHLTYRPASS